MAKRHGWLVGALQDANYQQRDLAKAWGVDDAVVSRFISSGKPDLTPERQMLLAQMLGMTNDQLLTRLFGDVSFRRVIPLRPTPEPQQAPAPASIHQDGPSLEHAVDRVQAEIGRAVRRLQELLPGATVTINISHPHEK